MAKNWVGVARLHQRGPTPETPPASSSSRYLTTRTSHRSQEWMLPASSEMVHSTTVPGPWKPSCGILHRVAKIGQS